MFQAAIFAAYFIVVLIYAAIYFFIIYHLLKYSISASLNRIMLPVFVVLSTLLLVSNIMLFLSINWGELLSSISL